jgi:hypothetical protein
MSGWYGRNFDLEGTVRWDVVGQARAAGLYAERLRISGPPRGREGRQAPPWSASERSRRQLARRGAAAAVRRGLRRPGWAEPSTRGRLERVTRGGGSRPRGGSLTPTSTRGFASAWTCFQGLATESGVEIEISASS